MLRGDIRDKEAELEAHRWLNSLLGPCISSLKTRQHRTSHQVRRFINYNLSNLQSLHYLRRIPKLKQATQPENQ